MSKTDNHSTIILSEDDLNFQVRFETVADKLGYSVILISEFKRNEKPESEFDLRMRLMDFLSDLQPVLVIIDLNAKQFPWLDWIPILKSDPATRRIPLICFGSHKETQDFKSALQSGADQVYARSKMLEELPAIIEKWACKSDPQAIQKACEETFSLIAFEGIQAFNRKEFFEAHELLEQAWMEEKSTGRDIYRALLQVAVAYLQVERCNYRGAIKMFIRLRQWIDPLPDRCRGIDIQSLRENAR